MIVGIGVLVFFAYLTLIMAIRADTPAWMLNYALVAASCFATATCLILKL